MVCTTEQEIQLQEKNNMNGGVDSGRDNEGESKAKFSLAHIWNDRLIHFKQAAIHHNAVPITHSSILEVLGTSLLCSSYQSQFMPPDRRVCCVNHDSLTAHYHWYGKLWSGLRYAGMQRPSLSILRLLQFGTITIVSCSVTFQMIVRNILFTPNWVCLWRAQAMHMCSIVFQLKSSK